MALLSDSDCKLITLIHDRLEHIIDLLNERIRGSSNDCLVELKQEIERLMDRVGTLKGEQCR